MIIVCGGLKGGTGKSTIATNLAVMRSLEEKDVLLVDGDDQRSADKFTIRRNETRQDGAGYTCIVLSGAAVRTETLRLKPKYDDVIIDVGGRDTTSLRSALVVADIFLVPIAPRTFDIETLPDLEEIIVDMSISNPNLKTYCFLSRADTKGQDNKEAANIILEMKEFQFINTPLISRKIYGHVVSLGMSVAESKGVYKDKKAAEEMTALYKFVFS